MDRPTLPEITETTSLDELLAAVAEARPYAEEQFAAAEPDTDFLDVFASLTEVTVAKAEAVKASRELATSTASALSSLDELTTVTEEEAPAETEVADEAVETEAPAEETDPEVDTSGEDIDDAGNDVVDENAETEEATDEVDDSAEATDDDNGQESVASTDTEEPEVDRPSADDLSGDTATETVDETPGVVTTARVVPGVPGFEANAPINSRLDVAKAMGAKWETVGDAGTGERFTVVQIKADYPEFADLTDGDFKGFYDDSIVAACAPLQPYYGVGFYSSESRPVFDSMPKFLAPRGGVTIYPSPRFSDPDLLGGDGMGQWTHVDDNNASAEKNDPYDFECDEPTDFRVYGVYKSMLIRFLDAITFPELVAAHQNQLGSRFARYAETLLLDAMVAQADENIHASATYGATRTVLSRLNQIGGWYRESERLEDTPQLDIWLPRWVRNALREDVIRANNDRGVPEVVVDATISSWFGDIGMTPHFTYDNPTTAGQLDPHGSGHVEGWPADAWYVLSVRGNLSVLDLGSIDIGVNPNGLYRDAALTKRNRFQMFMESFEGLVNRGAPVWNGNIEVLASGAAPAGVDVVDASDNI